MSDENDRRCAERLGISIRTVKKGGWERRKDRKRK